MAIMFEFSYNIYCLEGHADANGHENSCFLVRFGFDKIGLFDSIVKMSYYAFTTLSTVGFGDLYP